MPIDVCIKGGTRPPTHLTKNYKHPARTAAQKKKKQNKKKQKQDMTVPFARARAKLGGSIR